MIDPIEKILVDGNEYDQWPTYAAVIKYAILNNGAGLNSYAPTYFHAFTPLFAVCLALMDFIFNNMLVSTSVLNGLFSLGTLIILSKIINDFYHLPKKDAIIVLIVYQSNIVVCSTSALVAITNAITTFSITLAFYTNVKFVDHPDLENGVKMFIMNTVVLYCREIIWPFLIFCPALVLFKILVKQDNVKLRFKVFIKNELQAVYFAIILPGLCYLLFFLFVNAFPSISLVWISISIYFPPRTVPGFFFNAFIAFSFIPILMFLDIKGVCKKKENLPFLLWIGIFFLVRFIVPGALLYYYWEPIIFCFCILGLQPLKNERFKMKENRILSSLIITNLVILIFIAFIIPHLFIALSLYPTGTSLLENPWSWS